jgi:hypothetical protein
VEGATAAADSIGRTASSVGAERERVIAAIAADGEKVSAERVRMEGLVQEVSDLANEAAAGQLAKAYAKHAQEEEETADRYTTASIVVGAIAAVATCVIAYFAFTKEHGTGAVLTKAALALPVLAFAAYISRLATIHRRQGWRWRHIELQISTARPFVAPLDEDQRRLLTAALALRFFPGQRVDPEEGDAGSTGDPVAALGELLRATAAPAATQRSGESPPA